MTKQIAILAAQGAMASQLTGLMDFFMICNRYWMLRHNNTVDKLFELTIVSPDGQNLVCDSGIIVPAQGVKGLSPDAVLISGGVSYDEETLASYFQKLQPLFSTLDHWHKEQVPIAAFCSSTFVLAQLGYLDNKNATSVWWLAGLFHKLFPSVNLQMGQLVVQDGHLYTAGATSSYLSLCLMLVERLQDEFLASQVAKIMLIEPNRHSQLPYMSLQTIDQHQDSLVLKVQKWMYQHLAEPISLDLLAQKFATTKRTLNRRFKKALNDTPVNYLQKMRVESAKRLLETTDFSVEQIVRQVGYEDVSSFRKLFIETAELSPSAYRQKFQKREILMPCPSCE